jgi:uncharacterized protein
MIDTIILKVASRCNLACSYCYEYAAGDDSWRGKPRVLSVQVASELGARIREYADQGGPSRMNVVLHGGEPLLAGPDLLTDLIEGLVSNAGRDRVKLHIQTNGVLLTESICAVLNRFDVKVGVSLDGDEAANAARVDHRGRESWHGTIQGLNLLRRETPHLFGGLLCVVNPLSDPRAVMTTLLNFYPPVLDLLQPFITHEMADEDSRATVRHFGQWMIDATDVWLTNPSWHGTRVRFAEDAMKATAGVKPKSDWFGQRGVTYLIVETDGRYDLQDQLKVLGGASSAVRAMSGTALDMPIATAYEEARQRADILRINELPDGCAECRWKVGCAGGFAPTRFSVASGFNNPSTFCESLQEYFEYLAPLMAARSLPSPLT